MFLWYFECYIQIIALGQCETTHKRRFTRMPFETSGNTMDGQFDWLELRQRLDNAKEAIIAETKGWSAEKATQKKETSIAADLQHQHEQIVEIYKSQKHFTVDLRLANGSPFIWHLIYFGRPMTQLDGGIFNIKIYLSPRFPEEQPRVFVEPSLFHYRVSKTGILCYIPARKDDMRSHIEAIVATLEDEPPYDPRTTVNPEASRLFWGSPEDRKKYNRELRRSVKKSTE